MAVTLPATREMAEELTEEEIEALLDDLKRKLDRLRVLYEQFFLGTEKTPPVQARKDVVRMIHRLTQMRIRRGALKFRRNSLVQRFNSQKAYWSRTERELEMGTHKRQTTRAKKRQTEASPDGLTAADWAAINSVRAREGDAAADEAAKRRRRERDEARRARAAAERVAENDAAAAFLAELGDESFVGGPPATSRATTSPEGTLPTVPSPADGEAEGAKPSLAARAKKLKKLKALKAKSASRGASGPSSDDRAVYERLVATKKKLNQSVDSMNFDKLQRSLAAQREKHRKKTGRDVSFDVVVKDGKAYLKPVSS